MSESATSKYIKLLAPYIAVMGVFYQFTYWGVFRVNIFEYASLSELVGMSTKGMLIAAASYVLVWPFFLVVIAISRRIGVTRANTQNSCKSNAPLPVWRLAISSIGIPIGLLIATQFNAIVGLVLCGCTISLFLHYYLDRSSFLSEIKSKDMRFSIIIALLVAPQVVLHLAYIEAKAIRDADHFFYAETVGSFENARHIGHVSDFDFFLLDDESIVRIKSESTELKLIRVRNSVDMKAKPD